VNYGRVFFGKFNNLYLKFSSLSVDFGTVKQSENVGRSGISV